MSSLNLVQGGAEWKAARCGRVTASRIADLMAKTKAGWGASRANYMAELVAERLTSTPAERYTNHAMSWGNEHEAEARELYAFTVGVDVTEVGFVPHPSIAMTGASPDGLVGQDGLVEIKCPNTATHIETLLGGSVPGKYALQMQWQMECTGRLWCDFVSYDPRMPAVMQLFIRRLQRDDAALNSIRTAVTAFLDEAETTVTQLLSRYGQPDPKPVRSPPPLLVAG